MIALTGTASCIYVYRQSLLIHWFQHSPVDCDIRYVQRNRAWALIPDNKCTNLTRRAKRKTYLTLQHDNSILIRFGVRGSEICYHAGPTGHHSTRHIDLCNAVLGPFVLPRPLLLPATFHNIPNTSRSRKLGFNRWVSKYNLRAVFVSKRLLSPLP